MGKIRFWPPGFSTGSRAIAGGKPTATTTGDTMGIDTIGHLTEIILGVISTAAFSRLPARILVGLPRRVAN